jgi:hypothetical protein
MLAFPASIPPFLSHESWTYSINTYSEPGNAIGADRRPPPDCDSLEDKEIPCTKHIGNRIEPGSTG